MWNTVVPTYAYGPLYNVGRSGSGGVEAGARGRSSSLYKRAIYNLLTLTQPRAVQRLNGRGVFNARDNTPAGKNTQHSAAQRRDTREYLDLKDYTARARVRGTARQHIDKLRGPQTTERPEKRKRNSTSPSAVVRRTNGKAPRGGATPSRHYVRRRRASRSPMVGQEVLRVERVSMEDDELAVAVDLAARVTN